MDHKNYVFYDLETNGLDYYTTGIMQITMLDIDGNILLNQYTYPYDNRIDGTAIHGIDKEKLEYNNAVSTSELFILMKNILRAKYNRENVYLIAYNNFGYDQNILENNFKHVNIKMPQYWYFTDLFPIIKELYPSMSPNRKLATVFEQICGKDETINFHCALADTKCMYNIFKKLEANFKNSKKRTFNEEDPLPKLLLSDLLTKYTRPALQSYEIFNASLIPITGYNPYMKFENKNIYNIGDVYNIFKLNNYNNQDFESYMRNIVGIYSNYFLSNLIKQLNVIKHLHVENKVQTLIL